MKFTNLNGYRINISNVCAYYRRVDHYKRIDSIIIEFVGGESLALIYTDRLMAQLDSEVLLG